MHACASSLATLHEAWLTLGDMHANLLQALAQSAPQYIKYVYCGKPYAYEWNMNPDYVEEGIHPYQKGLVLLAECIKKDVDIDMGSSQAN